MAIMAGLAILCGSAHAGNVLYRCVDDKGRVTFTDTRCNAPGNVGKETTITLPDLPAPRQSQSSALASSARNAANRNRRLFYNDGKIPTFRFYYDPRYAPPEHTIEVVVKQIRRAAKAWATGCQVDIEYMGTAAADQVDPKEALSVSWNKEYITARHYAHSQVGIGGTGSINTGIRLRPRPENERLNPERAQRYLEHVILHEMGHVLGLPHNHEDVNSTMSYQQNYWQGPPPLPNSADYRDCNLLMYKNYDVPYRAMRDESGAAPQPRMTDREVLEKQRGRDPNRTDAR